MTEKVTCCKRYQKDGTVPQLKRTFLGGSEMQSQLKMHPGQPPGIILPIAGIHIEV